MMQSHKMTVDDREPGYEDICQRLNRRRVPAEAGRLETGDYSWIIERDDLLPPYVKFIVERKTPQDFVNSVADGRLGRFVDNEPVPHIVRVILLEGNQKKLAKSGFGWQETTMDNALLECQMRGVYVTSCQEGKVVERLVSIWEWSHKPHHRAIVRPALPDISNGYEDADEKRAIRFLMGLPGWGEFRARAVFRSMGSLRVCIEAIQQRDYKAFRTIHGVGKATIDAAADFIGY